MIEFVAKEVWVVEEEQSSRLQLLNFFLNGHLNDIVAIYNNGIFKRVLTYEKLLQGKENIFEGGVEISENIFEDAQELFIPEYRGELLPVVKDGELCSFLRNNTQRGIVKKPLQTETEIEHVEAIEIQECNDYTYRWLKEFVKKVAKKKIYLSGEGWELLIPYLKKLNSKVDFSIAKNEVALKLRFEDFVREKTAISSIYNLKEKYLGKKIYLYSLTAATLRIYTQLSFLEIKLQGICDDSAIDNERFLGKKLVEIEDIVNDADAVICVCDSSKRENLKQKYENCKAEIVGLNVIFELRPELFEKEIILYYDSIKEKNRIKAQFEQLGLKIYGSCFWGKETTEMKLIGEERQLTIDELIEKQKEAIIVLVVDSTPIKIGYEIDLRIEKLYFCEYNGFYYIERICSFERDCLLHISNAINEGKKIAIYGEKGRYTNAWKHILVEAGVQDYIVVKNIYDLAYESAENVFVIVNKDNPQTILAEYELIESMGFTQSLKNYVGLFVKVPEQRFCLDINVGYIAQEMADNIIFPGYMVHGEETEYKILVLGGSTTTEAGWERKYHSWPYYLAEIARKAGKQIIVYNGGVPGYCSYEELQKLIRDINVIRPNLVISYSGVNNINNQLVWYKSRYMENVLNSIITQPIFDGAIQQDISVSQMWIQQEKMMKGICKTFCVQFLAIAQAMPIAKRVLGAKERLIFDIGLRNTAIEFKREIELAAESQTWLIDMISVLDNDTDLFVDYMHVNSEGNRKIANYIYDILCERKYI